MVEVLTAASSAEGGTYETRFRRPPVDYSAWDCYRTPEASPAFVCDLTATPTEAESAEYQTFEKEKQERARLASEANRYLSGLTPERLTQDCGQGKHGSAWSFGDSSDPNSKPEHLKTFTYPSAKEDFDSTQFEFKQGTIWMVRDDMHFWGNDGVDAKPEEALSIMQTLPCLADQLR